MLGASCGGESRVSRYASVESCWDAAQRQVIDMERKRNRNAKPKPKPKPLNGMTEVPSRGGVDRPIFPTMPKLLSRILSFHFPHNILQNRFKTSYHHISPRFFAT